LRLYHPQLEKFKMKLKRLLAAFALLCGSLAFAQSKTPLVQPHWTFFDQSGAACAGCKLSTFLAGTTTNTPTYTDASGTSTNTNPIILDASGSANIWVGTATLKLVLKDSFGTTIWTADNIPAGGAGGGGCGIAGAITFENSTVTGLDCDAYITINKTLHTINVGGPLPANHFTMTNLSPVLSNWTFNVASPNAALLSLGKVPSTDITGPNASTNCLKWDGASPSNLTTSACGGTGTVTEVDTDSTSGITGGPISTTGTVHCAQGSSSQFGCVKVDGTTVQASAGVLSAPGGANSLTANGYQTFGSGLILQWASGTSMSDSSVTQTINFPIACPTQMFAVIPSSKTSIFDDTHMATFVWVSNNLNSAVIAMQRVPDHSYDAATPYIEVLCK